MRTTSEILSAAAAVKSRAALLTTEEKNRALIEMAKQLEASVDAILEANRADVEAARGTIPDVMIDRLSLNSARIAGMAEGLRAVAALPDPVGREISRTVRPNGLDVERVSVPFGVVAVIYESRPNVTSDVAALTVKSGNVAVLRCGKEAVRSARAVCQALRRGLQNAGLPADLVAVVEDTDRASSLELMKAVGRVDLLIPRGGAGLIRACVEQALVPCIETGTGICHVYVDRDADLEMALSIVENAKTSRPSVCNAEEVLLVDEAIAPAFLPALYERLTAKRSERGLTPVEFRPDEKAAKILGMKPAEGPIFDTEFLDYILAVGIVSGVAEAIEHIAKHSTHHSESIVTENKETAERFLCEVDSAAVYHNASTRFTDGGEFGLGCELGISTQKMHARGPMGLEELTSYKYLIRGNGQTR
ncbi:MAG: glutamate-5-semialdehyde dehydrogenase [Clostridia bacterium]|nr:glutamate-5-semialdehyde dehydrogenase [Clostridia bacterium]